jgi:hypothetical protein
MGKAEAQQFGLKFLRDALLLLGVVLLEEESAEIEAANWVDPNTVIVEAILAHCREVKLQSVYVGEIAAMAGKILERRGEPVRVERHQRTVMVTTSMPKPDALNRSTHI